MGRKRSIFNYPTIKRIMAKRISAAAAMGEIIPARRRAMATKNRMNRAPMLIAFGSNVALSRILPIYGFPPFI